MTEEEKKAAETMKHWVQYEKMNKEKINKADELIKIQETVLNLIQKQQEEIEKKDKQIDLMAEAIYNTDFYEFEICQKTECEHIESQNESKCIGEECIKEYFKKKVEDK